ncbi:MAG: type II toxin-antitoxin system PemK/MazF family toxin [Candidatus Vogelbacteria bacterium]
MGKTKEVNWPRRGDVYLVNFDPTLGAEIRKTRPALVIQNDIANQWSSITIVAAITSYSVPEIYPTEVMVEAGEGGLRTKSIIKLDQVRSIDKQRLKYKLGQIKPNTLIAVNRALIISLELVAI